MPCSLAILMEMGLNSVRNLEQQRDSNPQAPMPPIIFATSRGPIWRISTCDGWYCFCISWRRDLRSALSSVSVLNMKVRRVPSKEYSAATTLTPRSFNSAARSRQAIIASTSFCAQLRRRMRSRGVAIRSMGFQPSGGGVASFTICTT